MNTGSSPHSPLSMGALLGVGVMGVGTGLQLSSLFVLGTRVGLGTPLDTAVFGAVGAGLLLLGALLFGRLVRSGGDRGTIFVAAASAVTSLFGLAVTAAITSPLGFKAHCVRFGTDASLAGTPWVDGTAALVLFVAPAFGAGALLASARTRWRFVWLASGVALGWLLRPWVFDLLASVGWKGVGSAGVVLVGAGIGGVGMALFGALGWHERPTRNLGIMCGAALTASAMALPVTALVVYPPWQRFAAAPVDIFETAHHQFTLLPGGGEALVALMNQRPLNSNAEQLELERATLVRSLELYGEAAGTSAEPPRTLVIGLVTPERAALLGAAGIVEYEQASLVAGDCELVMERLWRGRERPGGSVLGAQDLRGSYDLVFSFPHGAVSHGGWDLALARKAEATVKTLWLDPDLGLCASLPGAGAALASNGIGELAFGIVTGLPQGTPGLYDVPAAPLGLHWMRTRPERRPLAMAAFATEAMAALESAGPWERGLARHAAAQRISSPFEAPLERIELDEEALVAMRDQLLSTDSAPSSLERSFIDGTALTLRAQGRVPMVFEVLGEIAARSPGTPRLELTLAWAEAQELDFEAAVSRLRPLVPADLDGASPLERAAATQLADALVALGDGSAEEGQNLALALARQDPQNPELFGLARRVRGTTTIGPPGTGYESLSLDEARERMDGAVLGQITGRRVREVDPGDGAPLYMTELTIVGTAVAPSGPGPEVEIQVLFPGGFQDRETGSFNSMAPPRHRTRLGELVLALYESSDNIIGGLSGHALLSGGAGLYSAFRSRDGKLIIQGRGQASAVAVNVEATSLGDLLKAQ